MFVLKASLSRAKCSTEPIKHYKSENQRFGGNGIKKTRVGLVIMINEMVTRAYIINIHRSLTFVSPNILLGIFLQLCKSSAGKCQQWLQHIKNHDEREKKYTYLTKNHCYSSLFSLWENKETQILIKLYCVIYFDL